MKRIRLLQITFFCLLTVFSVQSAFALSELGRNPFHPDIESEAELRAVLLENRDDVRDGLQKAGYGQLYEPLMAQLPDAEIDKVTYPKGHTFEWMFYRKDGKGKVRIDKDVVWEGDEPIRSFEFPIDFEGKRYTFAVPPVCGNLTLVAVASIPAAPVSVVPVAESEAKDPVMATTEQETEEAAAGRFPFLADVGYLHQLDPGHYVFARIGMEFPLNDSFSLIGMVGGAPQISGEDGENAFIADVFANYSFSRFFVGVGLGAWLTSGDDIDTEDDDLDLIVNVGARVFGEPDGFNTSVFLEARSGVDELDEFDLYGRIGGGLRFRF